MLDRIDEGLDEIGIEATREGQLGSSDRDTGGGTAAARDRPNRSTARARPTPRQARPANTTAVPEMMPASGAGARVRAVRCPATRVQQTSTTSSDRARKPT